MGRNINAEKEGPREVVPWEPFEVTIKRWCRVALQQLRDSYATQKVYKHGASPAYEIWRRNKRRTVYTFDRPYKKGGKRRKIGKRVLSSWGWFDESAYREKLQKQNPSADYWYSTGASYNALAVEAVNAFSEQKEFIISGEVRFRTTMQMAYAEAGVGATGRRHKRGGGDIRVQRSIPYKAQNRYIGEWEPMQGRTHRPSVRQQVNYMRRRMVWLAKKHFTFQLNTWLSMTLASLVENDVKVNTPIGNLTIEKGK